MILTLVAGVALAVPVVQDPQPDDVTAELVGIAQVIAAAESYTFTSTSENSGGGRGGFGGRPGERPGGGPGERPGERPGGDAPAEPPAQQPPMPQTIEGAYHSGLPMRVALGEKVGYREADVLVYQDTEGAWQVMQTGRGGRGGGGFGGGAGGAGGARGGDRAAMMALFQLRGARAPHALFADFGDKLESVSKEVLQVETEDPNAKLEKLVFTGALTEAGIQALGGGFGRRGGRGGPGGGGPGGGGPPGGGPPAGEGGGDAPERPQSQSSGTFVIEVVGGAITSATFETVRTMTFRDEPVERTTKRTLNFSKLGETTYEVPEDALAHFEI